MCLDGEASEHEKGYYKGYLEGYADGLVEGANISIPQLSILQAEKTYIKNENGIKRQITMLVRATGMQNGTNLQVKIIKDEVEMGNTEYIVQDNTVEDNYAIMFIYMDVDMNASEYTIEVSSEEYSVSDVFEMANEDIVIETKHIYIEQGNTMNIEYFTIPNTINADDLKFESSDANVATIEQGRIVNAVNIGEATITISTLDNRISDDCVVYVYGKGLEISEFSTTPNPLRIGEAGQINAKILATSSVNVEELDILIKKAGEDVTDLFAITANNSESNEINLIIIPDMSLVSTGEYTLEVSYAGEVISEENVEKQIRSFSIVSSNPLTGISAETTNTKMQVGDTKRIEITFIPENAANKKILWHSSNEDVATVNESGLITAVNKGETTIKATSDENPNAYVEINVIVQDLVETEEYVVDNNTHMISRIPENTSVKSFIYNLSIGQDEYQLLNKKGQIIRDTDLVGTGAKLKIGNEEYTLIVTGDTNGDGEITITDVSQVKLHFIGLELLDEIGQQAANTNHDNEISITDVSQIKLHFIGLEFIRP